MSKKYYHIIIALLVILNIFSWRMWWERPSKSKHGIKGKIEQRRKEPINFLAKKLDFSEEQKQQGSELFETYAKDTKALNKKIAETRRKLAQLVLYNQEQEHDNDSVMHQMTNYKMELELLTFKHFKSIRQICEGDQIDKMDSLLYKMMSRFDGMHGKRKRFHHHNRK